MHDRRAHFLDNHDGDTVKMMLDQGFGDTKTIDIRLLGVWAPELKEVGGVECREFVRTWFLKRITLTSNWDFIVTTVRMKVADREQKTLDRYVAVINTMDGSENLNVDIMMFVAQNGYGGGTGNK